MNDQDNACTYAPEPSKEQLPLEILWQDAATIMRWNPTNGTCVLESYDGFKMLRSVTVIEDRLTRQSMFHICRNLNEMTNLANALVEENRMLKQRIDIAHRDVSDWTERAEAAELKLVNSKKSKG